LKKSNLISFLIALKQNNMNKIKIIFSWLFRSSLELNKHWWHRLIKVIFISLFCLTTLAIYFFGITSPESSYLVKHNVSIKNTLYTFSENYVGKDNENTIPKFFEQKDNFGLLIGNKINYISEYQLGKSVCYKTPEKYLDGISAIIYSGFLSTLNYQEQQTTSLEKFTPKIKEIFNKDTNRKCFFFGTNDYDGMLKKTDNLSIKIINYKPNILYYIEFIIIASLITFISFVIYALIYYRGILYVVYGNKK
jgi:hypothetical protein